MRDDLNWWKNQDKGLAYWEQKTNEIRRMIIDYHKAKNPEAITLEDDTYSVKLSNSDCQMKIPDAQ